MNESIEAEPVRTNSMANGSTRLDTSGTGEDRSLYQSKEEKMKKIKS
jgi:hypothetical protein